MANKNKAKGTKWESDIARYLQGQGLDGRRKVQRGSHDEGDLEVRELPDVVIQAKDHATLKFSEWLRDVRDQGLAAGAPLGFVVAKRRQKSAKDAYVVCDLETWAATMKDLTEGRSAIEALELLERLGRT